MAENDLRPTVGAPPVDVVAAIREIAEILDELSEVQFECVRYLQVPGVSDQLRKRWGPISARVETLRAILRVST